jgi:hypothetical protein
LIHKSSDSSNMRNSDSTLSTERFSSSRISPKGRH